MNSDLQKAIQKANEACERAEKGYLSEAIAQLSALLVNFPQMVGARRNYATLLHQSGQSEEAIGQLKICLQAQPNFAEAWDSFGTTLLQTIRPESAFEAYSNALKIAPTHLETHSNRFLSTLYRCEQDKRIDQARIEWIEAIKDRALEKRKLKRNETAKKLRIGFVSPDFRLHSVAFFLLPVLEEWKKFTVELYLYSDVSRPDAVTSKFRSLASHFESIKGTSDEDVAARIRDDEVDVLFDLCGHFESNRQAVFAQRSAPMQVAWLGYPCTTFTPNIDHRITDLIIAGNNSSSTEKAICLSCGIHCFRPLTESPSIQPPPLQTSGTFTFGSFNNALKISPQIARVWGVILEQSSHSQLLLKGAAYSNKRVRDQIRKWISPESEVHQRIHFLERTSSVLEHLDCYNQIDLALDTFPYNGTTTTCEALWMGVPTLSLQHPDFEQSRVGASLLQQVRLSSFAVSSANAYIALARALVENPSPLQQYRSSLRTHLSKSSLMQPSSLVQELDQQIRQALGRAQPGSSK